VQDSNAGIADLRSQISDRKSKGEGRDAKGENPKCKIENPKWLDGSFASRGDMVVQDAGGGNFETGREKAQ
jgi:hypothetical protein